MIPTSTETIFQNLYTLLSQTQQLTNGVPNGTNAFLTTSRRAPQVSNAPQAEQPALYIMQGEQIVQEKAIALAKYEWRAAIIVLCRNTGGPNSVVSTQLNQLRDAVTYQFQQNTLAADMMTVIPLPAGMKQHLGNVVYHARIIGTVLYNEGLSTGQAAIVFPVSILSGM